MLMRWGMRERLFGCVGGGYQQHSHTAVGCGNHFLARRRDQKTKNKNQVHTQREYEC
jgi:hypothetical protein